MKRAGTVAGEMSLPTWQENQYGRIDKHGNIFHASSAASVEQSKLAVIERNRKEKDLVRLSQEDLSPGKAKKSDWFSPGARASQIVEEAPSTLDEKLTQTEVPRVSH